MSRLGRDAGVAPLPDLSQGKRLPARSRACPPATRLTPRRETHDVLHKLTALLSPLLGPPRPSTSHQSGALPAALTNGVVVSKALWEM